MIQSGLASADGNVSFPNPPFSDHFAFSDHFPACTTACIATGRIVTASTSSTSAIPHHTPNSLLTPRPTSNTKHPYRANPSSHPGTPPNPHDPTSPLPPSLP